MASPANHLLAMVVILCVVIFPGTADVPNSDLASKLDTLLTEQRVVRQLNIAMSVQLDALKAAQEADNKQHASDVVALLSAVSALHTEVEEQGKTAVAQLDHVQAALEALVVDGESQRRTTEQSPTTAPPPPTTTETTTTMAPPPDFACPPDFFPVAFSTRKVCYRVLQLEDAAETSWDQANRLCASLESRLPGFNSREELDWLLENSYGSIWLSLAKQEDGVWRMADREDDFWKWKWCTQSFLGGFVQQPKPGNVNGGLFTGCITSFREGFTLSLYSVVCEMAVDDN